MKILSPLTSTLFLTLILCFSSACRDSDPTPEPPKKTYALKLGSTCTHCKVTYKDENGKMITIDSAYAWKYLPDSMVVQSGFEVYLKAVKTPSSTIPQDLLLYQVTDSSRLIKYVENLDKLDSIELRWTVPF